VAPALTNGLSAAAQVQFKVLQQHFVTGLSTRWREITEAQTPQELQAALHRLSGAAGSYGFKGLGQCARVAELLSTNHTGTELEHALMLVETEITRTQAHDQSNSTNG
jgi:HPt (histidine-containing phosphotransfer) domain-containing protein